MSAFKNLNMKYKNNSAIKAIIFDLGGVLLDIDLNRTLYAFSKLGVQNLDTLFTFTNQTQLFDKLDKGLISSQDFRNEIRNHYKINITDKDFDAAWSALLIDFADYKVELLKKLAHSYRLFLLSNTNQIHYDIYSKKFIDKYGFIMESLFEKAYFSFNLGMRKPESIIFNHVLDLSNLNPASTLFIDDGFQHIEAAKALGIQTHYLTGAESLADLFE